MKYLIANWKMRPTSLAKAEAFFNELEQGLQGIDLADKKVIVCPPFPYLRNYELGIRNYELGAQNCGYEKEGAFTGEISPLMLKDGGVEYVIIGHSERRRFFKEDNEMIAKKVKLALEVGLTPIVCVGSPARETDEAERDEIKEQLDTVLNNLQPTTNDFLIAYEPVWAIGSGNSATPAQVKEMIAFIISITKRYTLNAIPCLYGGSVDARNVYDFTSLKNIDGCLVGTASIPMSDFIQLVKNS